MYDSAPSRPGSARTVGAHHETGRVRRWGTRRQPDPDVSRAYRLAAHAATLTRLSLRIEALLARCGRDGQHLRAASTAYDQTLLLAAADLGLGLDLVAPLPPIDRLMLEAELAVAGLRWSQRPAF